MTIDNQSNTDISPILDTSPRPTAKTMLTQKRDVQVPHNEQVRPLTQKRFERTARQAFMAARKIIKGTLSPSKEQVQIIQDLIRAYAATNSKTATDHGTKAGTLKIANTIARPGTGSRRVAEGQGGSTNAMPSDGVTGTVSVMTIKERLG
jgi:hypothetical protein